MGAKTVVIVITTAEIKSLLSDCEDMSSQFVALLYLQMRATHEEYWPQAGPGFIN